jgi:hypothetical protein
MKALLNLAFPSIIYLYDVAYKEHFVFLFLESYPGSSILEVLTRDRCLCHAALWRLSTSMVFGIKGRHPKVRNIIEERRVSLIRFSGLPLSRLVLTAQNQPDLNEIKVFLCSFSIASEKSKDSHYLRTNTRYQSPRTTFR